MSESPHPRPSLPSLGASGWACKLLVRCLASGLLGMVLVVGIPLLRAAQVRVPEGMLVRLKLHDDLTTENVVKGDRVEFDVTENVTVNDRVVIPKAAIARGAVVEVKGAGKKGAQDASVTFRFVAVRAADNQEIPLRAMPTKSSKGDSSDNEVEINTPIPGLREGMIGAEKGRDFAAYTDTTTLVNVPEPASTSTAATGGTPASGPSGGTAPTAGSAAHAPAPAFVLPPEEAYVDFNSNPSGAELLIDGASRGNTPLRLQVSPGRHVIEIRLASYRTWTRSMVVDPGSKPSVRATLEKE